MLPGGTPPLHATHTGSLGRNSRTRAARASFHSVYLVPFGAALYAEAALDSWPRVVFRGESLESTNETSFLGHSSVVRSRFFTATDAGVRRARPDRCEISAGCTLRSRMAAVAARGSNVGHQRRRCTVQRPLAGSIAAGHREDASEGSRRPRGAHE